MNRKGKRKSKKIAPKTKAIVFCPAEESLSAHFLKICMKKIIFLYIVTIQEEAYCVMHENRAIGAEHTAISGKKGRIISKKATSGGGENPN